MRARDQNFSVVWRGFEPAESSLDVIGSGLEQPEAGLAVVVGPQLRAVRTRADGQRRANLARNEVGATIPWPLFSARFGAPSLLRFPF